MKSSSFKNFFKKINRQLTFFDYLVFGFGFLIVIFIGLFFLRKMEWVEVEIKVSPQDFFWSEKNPPFWYANAISSGDFEQDGLGRKVAEVLEVRTYERNEQQKIVYLKAKLRVVHDKRKQQYMFRSRPVEIGSPIELRLSYLYLQGLVVNIEGLEDKRVWEEKIVETRVINRTATFPETSGVDPWIVEGVEVGDKMADFQGEVVAEVLDKKVRPAEKVVVTDSGKAFLTQDPIKKDLFLKLKLKTRKERDVNYFIEEFKVKINNGIPLHLPSIDIYPVITEILE